MTGVIFTTQGAAYAGPLVIPAAGVVAPAVIPAAIGGAAVGAEGVVIVGSMLFPDEAKAVARPVLDAGMWAAESTASAAVGAGLFVGRTVAIAWNWATDPAVEPVTTYDPPTALAYEPEPCTSQGWWMVSREPEAQNTASGSCQPNSGGTGVQVFQDYGGGTVTTSYVLKWTHYNASGVKIGQNDTFLNYYFRPSYFLKWTDTGAVPSTNPAWAYTVLEGDPAQGTPADIIDAQIWKNYPTATGPSVAPGTGVAKMTPRSECSDGTVVAGSVVEFTGKTASADLPPIVAPRCPAGTTRTKLTTEVTREDGSKVPGPVTWSAPTIPSAYAECNGIPPGGGVCELVLTRTSVEGEVEVCNTSGACKGWSENLTPEKIVTEPEYATRSNGQQYEVTQRQTAASGTKNIVRPARAPTGHTYRCQWGPYTVPVSNCLAVPVTPPPAVSGGTDATDGHCTRAGLGLNPITWVVVPLKCLFIPRQSVVESAATAISNAWAGTAPAVVAQSVEDVAAPVIALGNLGPQDCMGPAITIPKLPAMDRPITFHPFSTCHSFVQNILSWYLPIASGMVYLGCFFAGARTLMRTIGAGDGVPS